LVIFLPKVCFEKERPNGMAQRQRRDWRGSFLIMHHFWQNAPVRERRSRCPLEPVLGSLAPTRTLAFRNGANPKGKTCNIRIYFTAE
jgi:hypothetical protein